MADHNSNPNFILHPSSFILSETLPQPLPGLDALVTSQKPAISDFLRGKNLGLLFNQTSFTRDDRPALEALRGAGFNFLALFSPEHGPQGILEGEIASSRLADQTPIHSLYGATKRPTPEMLRGLDAIVCDLQDVGARFYTYSSTVFEVLEACAPLGIAVVILDRPNPLGDLNCEGPFIEPDLMSFIGAAPLPITHGLTLGELALRYRSWKGLEVEIQVAPVQNWQRAMKWTQTGLKWRQPSPNLPDFRAAAWYPGLCLLEFCALSVGRGTKAPFQILAAPDFQGQRFIDHFSGPEGITAQAIEVTPTRATFEGQRCAGVEFSHPNGAPNRPVAFGLAVMAAFRASHPDFARENWGKAGKLVGSQAVLDALWNGDLAVALEISQHDGQAWLERRAPFLIY